MMLDLTRTEFRHEPYPIGFARDVFASDTYAAMVRAYPAEESAGYVHMQGKYNKLSLSERNEPERYRRIVANHPVWRAVYAYVKSQDFILGVLRLVHERTGLVAPKGTYSARFEFSSLPGDGGGIEAHTDIPSKVVTLILPMHPVGASWDEAWGGGTDVLRPLDPFRRYVDYQEPRKAFETVATMPYGPNQAVVFVKTFNSWHAVAPIQAPAGVWRRTLTVNLEVHA